MMAVEHIEKDGKIYAMLPIEHFEALVENAEMLEDIRLYDEAKAQNNAALPWEVWEAIESGVGAGIAAVRKYRRMTQDDLATKSGVKQPYISAIESDKQQGTLDVIRAIAHALDMTLDDLVGE